jgi:hypothetical protein
METLEFWNINVPSNHPGIGDSIYGLAGVLESQNKLK